MFNKKIIAWGLITVLTAACEKPIDTVDELSMVVEKVGTSPITDCSFDASAPSDNFDIVITDGRVMDPECNFDGVRNVGIKGNRIVVITEGELRGARSIDAKGLVVAPGFINTHSHSFAPFEQRIMALDGTTTILDTELGISSANLFYDKYGGNSLLNYGSGISHEEVRKVVLDGLSYEDTSDPTFALKSRALAQNDNRAQWALDIATPEQHNEILRIYEQGLLDGAISVNTTLGYMGYGVPTYEIFDLQKLAKKYERIFGAHTRFGPTESLPTNYTIGVREVVANMVALDGAAIMSHINNANWQETYEICRRLQERDYIIFCEYYASPFGNPNIATPQLLPDKIKSNNVVVTEMLYNPDTGEPFESEEQFFKVQKEQPGKAIFVLIRDPIWMDQWPYMKDVALANDVITYHPNANKFDLMPEDGLLTDYEGHPRNAQTYSWALAQAREKNIPLMEMVNNAGYIPAKYFSRLGLKAMQERGRLQPGMIADITLFNPDTVKDKSTMKKGERGLSPIGIPYVIVSGELVVDDGEYQLGKRPGQSIRYESIEGTPDLDLQDKKYQWHADLPDVESYHRKTK